MKTPNPIAENISQQVINAAATQAAKAIDEKAGKALDKANQAAGIIDQAQAVLKEPPALPGISGINGPPKPGTTPAINGINGSVPFDELDTPQATEQAMAAGRAPVQQAAAAIDLTVPLISSRIFIGDLAIKDALSLSITQTLGRHNELKLRFFQDQAQAEGSLTIDGAEKLLGQVAEVELYNRNDPSSPKLQNLFVIADVQLEQNAQDEGILCLTGYAPTWILDGDPHFETFYKKDFNSIVKSVCKALPQVKAALKANATLTGGLPFVCRYNESVWNFLKRLCAETGQWLYFNGTALVVGKAESRQAPKISYGRNCYQVSMSLHARPVQQTLFDYEAGDHRPINSEANKYNGNAGAYNEVAFKKSNELFGGTPAVATTQFLPSDSATLKAIARGNGEQRAAGMYLVKGESNIYELSLGITAELDFSRRGQQSSHAPVRIISVVHNLDATGHYTNTFEAIPAAAEAPPPPAYQKPLTHPMLAEVIDNKDTKGRIRVKFLGWQQEGIAETDFIRVLTPDAGGGGDKVATNRGLVTIPEVGDQVYVDFEHGNPDRPFVTGSVFHGKVGMGGGNGNDGKSLTTKSGHTLQMHDGGGITLKDKSKLNHIEIDGTNKVTVTGDGTVTLVSKGNNITITSKDGRIEISSAMTIDVKSPTINIGDDKTDVVNIKATAINLTAEGNKITGQNHITGGDTKIDGGNVFIN